MSETDILEQLDSDEGVEESYVLVREVKLLLNVGHPHFYPRVGVKIWRSNAVPLYPYHFAVSHHVHTPDQAAPYYPSRSSGESETEVLEEAVTSTRIFLQKAIRAGHEPSEEWLVRNEDY